MRRVRRTRALGAVFVLLATALTSGCVVVAPGQFLSEQRQTIGDFHQIANLCASNSAAGGCSALGASGMPALSLTAQVLIGLQLPSAVTPPASFTSTGLEALPFAQSPTYAAELQRLAPAPAGARWVGYISAVIDYADNGGPQTLRVAITDTLGQGDDGSPFRGPLAFDVRIGARMVTAAFPGTRPVACGPSLTTAFDEDPDPSMSAVAWVVCADDQVMSIFPTRDLGILAGGAATGRPETLASLPFTLRYAGEATPAANFNLTATSTLPGATLAVTPGGLAPATNSDSQALVAVGIPASARAGTYDVTLRAKLANGQTRTGVGRLTVTGGASAVGGPGGGPAARLRLTTVLPRGLSAARARAKGVLVLIGATKPGTAQVQLFQGAGRRPKAAKGVRLRVPGPTRVLLKSRKLVKGSYRIVIRADGRTFVRRATLAR